MNLKRIYRTAVAFLFSMILVTQTCYAYIDPATTSYMIQIVAGVVIAFGAVLGVAWSRIKRLFKKKNKDNTDMNDVDTGSFDNEGKDYISAEDILNSKEGK